MGNTCCGPNAQEIEKMNREGRYTTKQIKEVLDNRWVEFNPEANLQVTQKVASSIVKNCVLSLTKFGGSLKFNNKEFNKLYSENRSPEKDLIDKKGVHNIVLSILNKG